MRLPAAAINPQSLPAFTGGHRPVGETRRPRRSTMTVVGSPSMRVEREFGGGGAKTILQRTMANADLLTDEDFKTLNKLTAQVEATAKRLSNGGLSRRNLRQMRNPYGKGVRAGLGRLRGSGRGVSNMAIANKHSGSYQRAWNAEMSRSKSGVAIILTNDMDYAAFLAFGTKNMRAHGPQTTAMARHKAAIDAEWNRLAREASKRANALNQVGMAARGGN